MTAACAVGQVEFTVQPDRTALAAGESFMVTATIVSRKDLGSLKAPPLPASPDFDVVRTNQNQSRSSSIQIINGRTEQKTEITYMFYYTIAPKHMGSFTFPALDISIDGQSYRSQPFTVTVSKEPVQSASMVVRLSLSKKVLYNGEQAILTVRIGQKPGAPVQPTNEGFSAFVGALDKALQKRFSTARTTGDKLVRAQEQIDGVMYEVYRLQYSVFPLSAGEVTIEPVAFEYNELQRSQQRRFADPFDGFFGGGFFGGGVEARPRTVMSNALSVKVRSLPPPPPDFTGAIGRFTMEADVSPRQIPAGEAVTLKIAVRGNSRPSAIQDVVLPPLPGFEIFTPEKQSSIDTTANGLTCRKTWKYLLIPRAEGEVALPPVSWTYFDAESQAYRTLQSQPFTLSVTKGKDGPRAQTRYLTQEDIREIGRDIRYIKTPAKLVNRPVKPYRSVAVLLAYPLPLLLALFSLLYKVQSKQQAVNFALTLRKRAFADASRRIAALAKKAGRAAVMEFLGTVSDILDTYVTRKFGFAAAGMTRDDLHEALIGRGADAGVAQRLRDFQDSLDTHRFSGRQLDEAVKTETLKTLQSIIADLDKTVRRKRKTGAAARLASLLLLTVLGGTLLGAPVQLWFEKANAFYEQKQYDSAAHYYTLITESGVRNGAVYYNLGNAWYRQNKLGLAVLNYEKALAIDPADPDIISNIKFANLNIVDRVPPPEQTFLDAVASRLHNAIGLRGQVWLLFGLLCALGLLFCAALFVSHNARLWIIYVSSLLLLFTAAVGASTGVKIYREERVSWAVVLDPSIDARNEPRGSMVLFTAHEGTKFRIRKKIDEWVLVSLPNGVSGWVEEKGLGRI